MIFPRMFQRFLFNLLIKKVKALRAETVGIIEKYNLQSIFEDMNNSLPQEFRRPTVVKLCDEVMFVVCFAGINGTTAALTTSGAFLQCKCPGESWEDGIDLSRYRTPADMRHVYRKDPYNYIKEACRVDPPVTSATTSLAQDEVFQMAGRNITCARGTYQQYVISLANRDEWVFADPSLFNPDRPELNKALTWNGAFSTKASSRRDEQDYPRLCPGRFFALDIVAHILNHAISKVQ